MEHLKRTILAGDSIDMIEEKTMDALKAYYPPESKGSRKKVHKPKQESIKLKILRMEKK